MCKILVVDDDKDILEAMKVMLLMENYEVKTSHRGDEAYDLVSNYQPDLILLDVLLSGSDGRQICKKLKSEDSTKGIPVIMISAHPTAEKSTKIVGADDFIAKPFEINHLLDTVKKYT